MIFTNALLMSACTCLLPTYEFKKLNLLDSWLLMPPPPSSGASPTAATDTTQHHKAERVKFEINSARTSVQVFEDLVNDKILLLPFTVDHLGGIGTLAYCLLFGPDENKAPTPTTTPRPNSKQQPRSLQHGLRQTCPH
jgi:hypothetical protein|mmetsp:Transcript_8749/g.15851  ORF Transcript_8749/g.15851 Transcript_8749/m.15851 type:complete len:138 (+) Transcript_8749:2394-2807(+)